MLNKKDKVLEIIEREADRREKNDNHNVSSSKRKILSEIEELVNEQERKKVKLGRHQYVLLALIGYLVFFPIFFLSFLIPLGILVVIFIYFYKADKKSKEYQFEHKFWIRMTKEIFGV
jgi:hypothetical protein